MDTTETDAKRKSPRLALLYSLGGTLAFAGAGLAAPPLLVVGAIAGPSAGHFYANNAGQAWRGIGIRTGGLLITAGGAFAIAVPGFVAAATPGPQEMSEPSPFYVGLMVGGVAIVVGSGIYDIGTAWGAARDYNEARGLKARIAPTTGVQGRQVGLALHLRF